MQQLNNRSANRRKPGLLAQVRDAIRTKHYSIRTEAAYVYWIHIRMGVAVSVSRRQTFDRSSLGCRATASYNPDHLAACGQGRRSSGRCYTGGKLSFASPFICHPFAGERRRYSYRASVVRTQRCQSDHGHTTSHAISSPAHLLCWLHGIDRH